VVIFQRVEVRQPQPHLLSSPRGTLASLRPRSPLTLAL
jgi:hypothetical protein